MENMTQQAAQPPFDRWQGKPYYSLDAYCKNTYGEKLYKTAIDLGLSCPNRDGTAGSRGCIFCSAGGSGEFAVFPGKCRPGEERETAPLLPPDPQGAHPAAPEWMPSFQEADFRAACQKARSLFSCKKTGSRFIIYFQAYTNTYGPLPYLEKMYRMALDTPTSAGISIATRPDCLPLPVLELLARLKKEYPGKLIWAELGLQTIHEKTASLIRRGYPLSCFEEAVQKLEQIGIPVIVHLILGLPGESRADMLASVLYLNGLPIQGIKLQLLHILKGTDLGALWEKDPSAAGSFSTMESYLDVLIHALERLRPDMVVHRVTGDAPRELLLAPLWSAHKRRVLNTLHQEMKRRGTWQGKYFEAAGER